MKARNYFIAATCLSALAISPAVFGQLAPPSPTSLQSTIAPSPTSLQSTIAPARAVAPAPTPISASMGKGYEHANERGREAIEDHFAMTGTISDDVLTVTSITSGHIKVGTKLSGTGLPEGGITITELLTGKGGVGTYKFKKNK